MVGLASKKQILIVGNDALHLYVASGKTVSLYSDFSTFSDTLDAELSTAFRSVGLPLVVLFDVVEQQYRKEVLPQVNFMDKNKVIQRKLQMAFPQQKMRSFVLMNQKPHETSGPTALFTALSDSALIDSVMRAIVDSAVSVIGSGLLPMESTGLITKLVHEAHQRAQTPDDTRWSVLMTYHKTGGLRQVVIKDGELALTRMTPIPVYEDNIAQLTDEMVREFNATLTYLSRFGYVPSDGLDLVVVSSTNICQRLRQYGLPVTHLYPLTIPEAGQLIGVNTGMYGDDSPFADILHAAWTGNQKKLFVPLESSLLNKVKTARQLSKVAILLLLIGGSYLAYQNAIIQMDNMSKQDGLSEQTTKNRALKNEVDELSRTLNTLKYDPEKTSVMLDLYAQYKKQNLDVEPTLQKLLTQIDRTKYSIKEITIVENTSETEVAALQQAAVTAITAQLEMAAQAKAAQEQAAQAGTTQDGSGEQGNAPAPTPEPITPPETKAVVTIKATIGFAEDLTVEDAARETYDFIDRLQNAFIGREIVLDEIAGNLSEDKTVEGRFEETGKGEAKNNSKKSDLTSKFTIKGMLE